MNGGAALLAGRGLTVRLGERTVLRRISLELHAGSVLGLVGPNGAGKSTLVRTLAGLLGPGEGEVLLFGARPDPRVRARTLAYLPQGAPCHWPLTVRNLVRLGRLPHRAPWSPPRPEDEAAVEEALAETDVAHLAERPVTALSGGEQLRVHLARVLAGKPRILLADEPVAALDPGHQLRTLAHLRRLARSGVAVLLVLHDLSLAARYCDRLLLLAEGHALAQGVPAEVLTDALLARAWGIRALRGEVGGRPWLLPWETV